MDIIRDRRNRQLRKQRDVKLKLLLVATIFAICWLPLNVLNIVVDFSAKTYEEYLPLFDTLFVATHLFAMSSAVANPFLYGLLNENFRNEFRDIFDWVRLLCGGRASRRMNATVEEHAEVPLAGQKQLPM